MESQKKQLITLLKGIPVAMMTTLDDHGDFHSRPMAVLNAHQFEMLI